MSPIDRPPFETSVLANLNERSREIFRRVVDSYLATGEPVGSRQLSRLLPMTLSPASVRNVMQDLEELGLIAPEDKALLVTADTPDEVCDHVLRASERQKALA